jgi:hypothetical protein
MLTKSVVTQDSVMCTNKFIVWEEVQNDLGIRKVYEALDAKKFLLNTMLIQQTPLYKSTFQVN